jgi:hypothetical protein
MSWGIILIINNNMIDLNHSKHNFKQVNGIFYVYYKTSVNDINVYLYKGTPDTVKILVKSKGVRSEFNISKLQVINIDEYIQRAIESLDKLNKSI